MPELDSAVLARLQQVEKTLGVVSSALVQSERRNAKAELEEQSRGQLAKADQDIRIATKALQDAQDEGDSAQIAEAHRKLTAATVAKERVQLEIQGRMDRIKRDEEANTRTQDDSNFQAWKGRNKWYGVDDDMTSAAHRIHDRIISQGVLTEGTPEYFEAIDREMIGEFPDRFQGGSAASSSSGGGNTGSSGLRMNEDMQRSADRLGMTPEQWKESRDEAVRKGLLPQTPVSGRLVA